MANSVVSTAINTPAAWALTRGELAVFRSLLVNDTVPATAVAAAAQVTPLSVGVLISRLRKKIAPHGVEIETVTGKGWRLEGRETWRTALAAINPATGDR